MYNFIGIGLDQQVPLANTSLASRISGLAKSYKYTYTVVQNEVMLNSTIPFIAAHTCTYIGFNPYMTVPVSLALPKF